jgi:hydroxyacylglutathione hydrolase
VASGEAAVKSPGIAEGLPENNPFAIRFFWAQYWAYFFCFLPWMLLRQVFVGSRQVLKTLWTWNRAVVLLEGRFIVRFVDRPSLLFVSAVFGERLTAFRYEDVLVDPGPPFAGIGVLKGLLPEALRPPKAVLVTHYHEEHLGNAPAVAAQLHIPLAASRRSLAELGGPEELSVGRAFFMGLPSPRAGLKTRFVQGTVTVGRTKLRVLQSPGHCRGHISFFDSQRGLLFAGDSFLNEIFTSPNGDVDSFQWLKTLKSYRRLPIRTLVNSHGELITLDASFGRAWGVVLRQDPQALIQSKIDFIEWAMARVAEGEARGLPYSVIEATLFPWEQPWTWKNWFNDESFRLFTWGEFSRTHLVRSLSRHPREVPSRFSVLDAWMRRLGLYEKQAVKELLALHMVAFRPRFVLGILGGLLLSALPLAAGMAQEPPAIPWGSGFILAWWFWLTLVWGTWGSAVTRQMALVIQGRQEPLMQSFLKSLRPSLLYPGALASLCLMFIVWKPWAFIVVAPLWLYAGFVYGVLCFRDLDLVTGLRLAHRCVANWKFWLPQQIRFLAGFAVTTAFVYLSLGALSLVLWQFQGIRFMAVPIIAYALAYTTSNLKMLQVYLSKQTLEKLDQDPAS